MKPAHNDWGPWWIDVPACCLYLTEPRYEIDLERLVSKTAILGQISHMADKGWMDDAKLAGLTRAMNDLFHPHWTGPDPGAAAEIRKQVAHVVRETHELWPYAQRRPYIDGEGNES